MAQIIDGKKISQKIDLQTVEELKTLNASPLLVIVNASSDPASQLWIENKQRKAASLGIATQLHSLTAKVHVDELIKIIQDLSLREDVNGIIVQLPLYSHLEDFRKEILSAVSPEKDIDGLHPLTQGLLAFNKPTLLPATVGGIIAAIGSSIIKDYVYPSDLDLSGKNIVIVSHSILIGRPLAQALLNYNGTITVAHRYTKNLSALTKQADILISATGVVGLIKSEMVKPEAIVIDVSTVKTDEGLKGDCVVDKQFIEKVSAYTPVPGGIGPLTTSVLLHNLVSAAKRQQTKE